MKSATPPDDALDNENVTSSDMGDGTTAFDWGDVGKRESGLTSDSIVCRPRWGQASQLNDGVRSLVNPGFELETFSKLELLWADPSTLSVFTKIDGKFGDALKSAYNSDGVRLLGEHKFPVHEGPLCFKEASRLRKIDDLRLLLSILLASGIPSFIDNKLCLPQFSPA